MSWLPALNGWLVTRYDLAVQVMRDADTFTVEDPRFSTAQVVGPSMLSLDGDAHTRHRAPFAPPFRPRAVRERFAAAAAGEADRLIDRFDARRNRRAQAHVRRTAGRVDHGPRPRARAGRGRHHAQLVRRDRRRGHRRHGWTRRPGQRAARHSTLSATASKSVIVAGTRRLAARRRRRAPGPHDRADRLERRRASVRRDRDDRGDDRQRPAGPARASRAPRLDRARPQPPRGGARGVAPARARRRGDRSLRHHRRELRDAQIRRGELVRVSISAANRDPAVFPDPNRFDPGRVDRAATPRRHLTFAHGPHVCLGVHLARLEARTALETILCETARPARPTRGVRRTSGAWSSASRPRCTSFGRTHRVAFSDLVLTGCGGSRQS